MGIESPIIPHHPVYIHKGIASTKAPQGTVFDYHSIAVWATIGFFLGDSTFYKDVKVLQPSCRFENGQIFGPDWEWHYSPRDINLAQTVDEFSNLFEKIIDEQTYGAEIILPLSGGLDSRTLFATLNAKDNLILASYEFEDGFQETIS